MVGYEPQSRPPPVVEFKEAVSGSRPGYEVKMKKSSRDTKRRTEQEQTFGPQGKCYWLLTILSGIMIGVLQEVHVSGKWANIRD